MQSNQNIMQVASNENNTTETYKGYYLFQMYIHSVSELHLEDLIDGIFKIQVGDNVLYSSVIKELGTGEKILIQQTFQTQVFVDHESDFDNTLIQVQLNDHSRLLNDTKMFSLCFSLKNVYDKPDHQEINVWNIFLDYEKSSPFMGYVNYSVCCQATNQVPKNLMTLHLTETESNFKIPKNLKTKTRTLQIKIFTGELFQKTDFIGLADAYLKFTVGDMHRKTITKSKTLTPEFNQILYFKLMFPFALENLRIQLIDHDSFDTDDLLGTIQIKLKNIVKGDYKQLRYFHFYGGDENGQYKDSLFYLNSGHGVPSKLKGQVLISMQFLTNKEEDDADFNYNQLENLSEVFQTIDEQDHQQIKILQQQKFFLQVHIQSLQNVYLNGKFKAYLQWGKKRSEIRDFRISFIYNELNLTLNIEETFLINKNLKNDIKQVPDLYLYIERDKQILKFLKLSYKELLQMDSSVSQDFILNDDFSNNQFYHQFPGLITCKISTSKIQIQNHTPLSKLEHQDIYIYSQIYQGRDLAGLDDTGLSDPQVFITYKDVQKYSSIQYQTINPQWNEHIEIKSKQITNNKGSLIVELFDIDKNVFTNNEKEFIGYFYVDLNKNEQDLAKPTWYQLQQGQLYLGKVLMSFQYSHIQKNNFVLQQMQQTEYILCTEILGLRNLLQNNIFKIKNPEIWLPNFKEDKFVKLKIEDTGSNLNFSQTVNINAKLPAQIENFPNYSIVIKKNNFSFLESEKLIGTVTIDLQQIYVKSSQYIIERLTNNEQQYSKALNNEIQILVEKLQDLEKTENLRYQSANKFQQNIKQINDNLIIYPKFKTKTIDNVKVEVISEAPDRQEYMKLGYKSKDHNSLHFRKFFDFELEKFLFLKNYVYEDYEILKGRQKLPSKFYDQFEQFMKQKVQGDLRSKFFLIKKEIYDDLQNLKTQHNFILKDLPFTSETKYPKKQTYTAKIYLLQAQFYIQNNLTNSEKSYYCIEIQGKKIKSKDFNADTNPKFYTVEQISFTIPGDQQLIISFYKNNYLLPDTLVGQTTIELENRILNTQFDQLDSWLIETRQIKKIESKTAEGVIMLGIDIDPEDQNTKTWDIAQQPATELELRLIIWNLHTITHNSLFSGTDIFVKAIFPNEINKQTDTHNRSTGGKANFNYRMVVPLEINEYTKVSNLNIVLKIFDADFLSNDYIAEAKLEIGDIVEKVLQTEKSLQMNQKSSAKGITKFKVKCQDKVEFDDEGNVNNEDVSQILVSLECLTKKDANLRKAGQGREAPNQYPFLPEPKRQYIRFSINDTLKEQFGPNIVRNIIIFAILVFIITYLAALAAKQFQLFLIMLKRFSKIRNFFVKFDKEVLQKQAEDYQAQKIYKKFDAKGNRIQVAQGSNTELLKDQYSPYDVIYDDPQMLPRAARIKSWLYLSLYSCWFIKWQ